MAVNNVPLQLAEQETFSVVKMSGEAERILSGCKFTIN